MFLDVDGVLNTLDSLGGGEEDSNIILDRVSGSPLERRCLSNLVHILDRTGAKIVVTSTWRLFPDMMQFLTKTVNDLYKHSQAWQEQGKGQSIEGAEKDQSVFIGCTTDDGAPPFGGGRGQEVRIWLESHPECDRFVVLDDDHKQSFQNILFGEKELPHSAEGILIETKLGGILDEIPFTEQGLTEEHVETAVNFLNDIK